MEAAVLVELRNGGQRAVVAPLIFAWMVRHWRIEKLLLAAEVVLRHLLTAETVGHQMVQMLCKRHRTAPMLKVDVVVLNLPAEQVAMQPVGVVTQTTEAVDH
jgi:hypothetical protein